jgi:hypothetical protein
MDLSEREMYESLGAGVSVEFTRDSPTFRQNINAFEDSFTPFSEYCFALLSSLHEYDIALLGFKEAQHKLSSAFKGQSTYSRCLFTNSLPKLNDVSVTLKTISNALDNMNIIYENFRQNIHSIISPIIFELSKYDLKDEMKMKKDMENFGLTYENMLDQALLSRTKMNDSQLAAIVRARSDYELSRFDLVQRLNYLDCTKKFNLSTIVNLFYNNLSVLHHDCSKILLEDEKEYFNVLNDQIHDAEIIMNRNNELWKGMRIKLSGEIVGALPPPGAPLGEEYAMS